VCVCARAPLVIMPFMVSPSFNTNAPLIGAPAGLPAQDLRRCVLFYSNWALSCSCLCWCMESSGPPGLEVQLLWDPQLEVDACYACGAMVVHPRFWTAHSQSWCECAKPIPLLCIVSLLRTQSCIHHLSGGTCSFIHPFICAYANSAPQLPPRWRFACHAVSVMLFLSCFFCHALPLQGVCGYADLCAICGSHMNTGELSHGDPLAPWM